MTVLLLLAQPLAEGGACLCTCARPLLCPPSLFEQWKATARLGEKGTREREAGLVGEDRLGCGWVQGWERGDLPCVSLALWGCWL